jgi:hypothetical protein
VTRNSNGREDKQGFSTVIWICSGWQQQFCKRVPIGFFNYGFKRSMVLGLLNKVGKNRQGYLSHVAG